MDTPLLSRKIRVETNLRCDCLNHELIPVGAYATQVVQGKAQGLYKGRLCYERSLQHYEQLENETL